MKGNNARRHLLPFFILQMNMKKTEERRTAEDIVRKIFTKDRRKFKTQKEFIEYLKNLLLSSIEIQQTAIKRLEEANERQKILIETANLIEKVFPAIQIFIEEALDIIKNFKPRVVIAKEKYTKAHFKKVQRLVDKGYKIKAAIKEITEKEHFTSEEGFARQFRDRYQNIKIIPSEKHNQKE
jgi:hypothetical protein